MSLALNKPKLDNLAGDIWKSAERLRGKFKGYEYQGVIMPILNPPPESLAPLAGQANRLRPPGHRFTPISDSLYCSLPVLGPDSPCRGDGLPHLVHVEPDQMPKPYERKRPVFRSAAQPAQGRPLGLVRPQFFEQGWR